MLVKNRFSYKASHDGSTLTIQYCSDHQCEVILAMTRLFMNIIKQYYTHK